MAYKAFGTAGNAWTGRSADSDCASTLYDWWLLISLCACSLAARRAATRGSNREVIRGRPGGQLAARASKGGNAGSREGHTAC